MKFPISLIILAFFLVIFFTPSCTSVSKEELIPPGCDTVGMTYQADVVPILQAHCYTCHSAVNPSSGFPLEGYINLHPYTVDTAGGRTCTLVGNISHDPGYHPMPYPIGTPMIDTCLIHQIIDWVNRGAKND
jgi:hypothetical protein